MMHRGAGLSGDETQKAKRYEIRGGQVYKNGDWGGNPGLLSQRPAPHLILHY